MTARRLVIKHMFIHSVNAHHRRCELVRASGCNHASVGTSGLSISCVSPEKAKWLAIFFLESRIKYDNGDDDDDDDDDVDDDVDDEGKK